MKDNLKNIELIEAYFEGRLTPDEKVDFEVRLLVDQELQEEYELYQKILFSFNDIKADRIRNKLKDIDRELDWKKRGGGGSSKQKLILAGSALIALALSLFIAEHFSNTCFSAAKIPFDPGLPVLMGERSELEFDNAMTLFKAGDFPKAAEGFESFMDKQPQNDTALFYLGNSQLHAGDHESAILTFAKLTMRPESEYYEKGQYYLALSYWADERNADAVRLFASIAGMDGHPFQQESRSNLEQLR